MATFKKKQDERQKKSQAEPKAARSQQQNIDIIGEEEVKEAAERMKTYQASKATIDQKATSNQDWWRLRHWSMMSRNETAPEKSTSAWLFNSIINKHADIMDNYPKPNILPREADDEEDAKSLSKIIPVMLEQNQYRRTYSTAAYDFINDGGCITGVFWDNTKNDGMGDVTIQQVDIHNVIWEPGIENLQDSREVFVLSSVKNDDLIAQYPQMQDKTGQDYTKVEYTHDEQRDTSDESIVVDWYYKVQRYEDIDVAEGISIPRPVTTLHYCKFCNGVLLYASENDPAMDKGFYHHGKFPLVIRRLFPIKDSPWGFGYIDIMKNPQMYIDVIDTMIANNAVQAGKARFWVREDAAVNMDDFADWSKAFVRFSGNIDDVINLRENASRDCFTGLYNKTATEKLISERLRKGGSHAMMIIDIDNFKNVNDVLGHDWGDNVIKDIASKISSLLDNGDIAGRIGGDEFMAFISGDNVRERIDGLCKALCDRIRHTYSDEKLGREVSISASIGVAAAPDYGKNFKELYTSADIAMYISKTGGKDRFTVYSGQERTEYKGNRHE